MLDQLVESKSNSKENKRRSEFLLVTVLVIMVGFAGRVDVQICLPRILGWAGDDLALTTLVAPVPVPDEEPPPEPEKKPEKQKQPDVDVRKELIQNMMQTPVKPPDTISIDQEHGKGNASRPHDKDWQRKFEHWCSKLIQGWPAWSTAAAPAAFRRAPEPIRPAGDEAPPPPTAKQSTAKDSFGRRFEW